MTSPKQYKHIYFLGIGGIGMSALARYFNHQGVKVSGYDRTASSLTEELQKEGIGIDFSDDPKLIPTDIDLVVFTPAIPSNHQGMKWLQKEGFAMMKRSEMLGRLTNQMQTLAVAGTHGKTTTSTMAAHLLYNSKTGCTAILGGIAKNYKSNLLLPNTASSWMVTEADEYDRSFLQITPTIAVITATDADHLDIYGNHQALLDSFNSFTSLIKPGGYLVHKLGLPLTITNHEINVYTYSLNDTKADCHARNLSKDGLYYTFDLVTPLRTITNLCTGIPALVNVENSIAACTMALLAGCSDEEIRLNLKTFQGISRRFDIRAVKPGHVYIDDYAHHPEEINALVDSVRHLFPEEKITAVFQPHLYSRTRDFAEGFAKALNQCDECLLLDIYPARELPIPGVDSAMLANLMKPGTRVIGRENLIYEIEKIKPGLLLTIGAGDIDRLVPEIEKLFNSDNYDASKKI